jgi:hypothetical protein
MKRYGIPINLVLVFAVLSPAGCRDSSTPKVDPATPPAGPQAAELSPPPPASETQPTAAQLAFVEQVRPQVEKFCSDCHAMPRPSSSPRDEWGGEVDQGFMLYYASGRKDLAVPSKDDVLKFFQYQAPDELALTATVTGYPPAPVKLQPQSVRLPGSRPPGVTNVRWIDLGLKQTPALVYCDIGTGAVKAHWPGEADAPTVRLGTVLQPVHVEPCDLDADGLTDLVVADIGEFNANDSDLGQVVWLRRQADSEKFEKIVLQDGLSRVADVQPGDFDGDGDLDLLVGVFGWRNSGRTILLVNDGKDDNGLPRFSIRDIDDRHGPVHVTPTDLNGDGQLDFVALISQEHEVVEAFINDGTGNFKNEIIWSAPDPAYGSSGIQLVDMDGDEDLDVLYTNGDSFDRGAKPHHSIQWLENEGTYPYTHHRLCEMPGVLTAKAGDFDGDGDMDVVAASLLAGPSRDQLNAVDSSSVVLLQQTSPGTFQRTKVEGKLHQHISLEIGDFDDDGKLDFAVGNFLREGSADQPDLIIWWNRR